MFLLKHSICTSCGHPVPVLATTVYQLWPPDEKFYKNSKEFQFVMKTKFVGVEYYIYFISKL